MSTDATSLNFTERKHLDDFLKSVDAKSAPTAVAYLFAGTIAIVGLGLFVYTSSITVDRLSSMVVAGVSRADIWMSSAGLIVASTLIAAGLMYLIYA
jgi:hypothetical protein